MKSRLTRVLALMIAILLLYNAILIFQLPVWNVSADAAQNDTKRYLLIAEENIVMVAPDNILHPGGIYYNAMTFNGTIPGPVLAVNQGDTLQITVVNKGKIIHSLVLNAGAGEWEAISGNILPGQSKTFVLRADTAGAFLYHCDGDDLNGSWEHIANGMYGGVVVHAKYEKPAKEFYMVFGEIYNTADKGLFVGTNNVTGSFDLQKLMNNAPDLLLTNGMAHKYVPSIGSVSKITLNKDAQVFKVKPGELTRWYIVNPGPDSYVAFHFIAGQIDVRDGSVTGKYGTILKNDETWTIPPGSASVIESTFPEDGVYVGVDHDMAHVLKGAAFVVVADNNEPANANDQPAGSAVPRTNDLKPHATIAVFQPPNTVERTGVTVRGVITDEMGVGLNGQTVTFPGSSPAFPQAHTGGISFTHPSFDGLQILSCSVGPGGCPDDPQAVGANPINSTNYFMRLHINGTIMIPENVDKVTLWIMNNTGSTSHFELIVNTTDSRARSFNYSEPPSRMELAINLIAPNDMTSIKLKSVNNNTASNGYIDVDALVTYNMEGIPQAKEILSFDNPTVEGNVGPVIDFDQGIFFSTADVTTTTNITGIPAVSAKQIITANFADGPIPTPPDPTPPESHAPYHSPDSGTGESTTRVESHTATAQGVPVYPTVSASTEYRIEPDTSYGQFGFGSVQTTPAGKSAAAISITSIGCTGQSTDSDADGLCDTWENGQGIGSTQPYFLSTADDGVPTVGAKDLYFQYDYMAGFGPTSTDITNLKNYFSSAGITLHIMPKPDQINYSNPFKYWSDSTSGWLGGLMATSVSDGTNSGGSDRTRQVQVTGLSVLTSGGNWTPTLDINVTLTFSSQDPGSLSLDSSNPVTFAGSKGSGIGTMSLASGSQQFGGTGLNRWVKFTLNIPVNTATDSSTGALGTINVNLLTGSVSPQYNAVLSSAGMGLNGPIITNNDDFYGVKANYFGTAQDRLTAGGTLSEQRPYLQNELQMSIYGLYVNNTGTDIHHCGRSGDAEWQFDGSSWGGNDIIISVGAPCFQQTSDLSGSSAHELGHTMGLRHGGGDDTNCKVNYASVMNYIYQVPETGLGSANWPPGTPNGTPPGWYFSTGKANDILERALSEPSGLGTPPAPYKGAWALGNSVEVLDNAGTNMDWNGDGNHSNGPPIQPFTTGIASIGGTLQAPTVTLVGYKLNTNQPVPMDSRGTKGSVVITLTLTFSGSGNLPALTGTPSLSVGTPGTDTVTWDSVDYNGQYNVWVRPGTVSRTLDITIGLPFTASTPTGASKSNSIGSPVVTFSFASNPGSSGRVSTGPAISGGWASDINTYQVIGCLVDTPDKIRIKGFDDVHNFNLYSRIISPLDGVPSFGNVETIGGDSDGGFLASVSPRNIEFSTSPAIIPEMNADVVKQFGALHKIDCSSRTVNHCVGPPSTELSPG